MLEIVNSPTDRTRKVLAVNTSNPGKLAEYHKYFAGWQVHAHQRDLPEPAADSVTIIRYKASQFENVLVDDVSLEVEGLDVGVNVRWLLDKVNGGQFAGKAAIFRCYLGVRQGEQVKIYAGVVHGHIVAARGHGFGFSPVFLPDGAEKTLGEEMLEPYNARYLAIQDYLADRPLLVLPPLCNWSGAIQH